MGIQSAGPFGGFYKKTGPLVGRRRKSKNIITALPHKSNKPATALQLQSQQGFSVFMAFLGYVSVLINKGFKSYSKKRTELNAAYKYNYGKSFGFLAGLPLIDYSQFVYSRGQVAIPNCPSVQLVQKQFLQFSWLPESQAPYNLLNDRANFLIYNESKQLSLILSDVVSRSALTYSIGIPKDFLDDTLHCYMNFDRADGKATGDSVYVTSILT